MQHSATMVLWWSHPAPAGVQNAVAILKGIIDKKKAAKLKNN